MDLTSGGSSGCPSPDAFVHGISGIYLALGWGALGFPTPQTVPRIYLALGWGALGFPTPQTAPWIFIL